jgi:hypothetical protein
MDVVAAPVLLRGAWYSLEQCGRLLPDAVGCSVVITRPEHTSLSGRGANKLVREPVSLQRVRSLITEGELTIRGVAWSGAAPYCPGRSQNWSLPFAQHAGVLPGTIANSEGSRRCSVDLCGNRLSKVAVPDSKQEGTELLLVD